MASRLQSVAGQLPASKTTLYTCGTLSTAVLKITAVNTDSVARTVNFYIKKSGSTSRRLTPKNTSVEPGYLLTVEVPQILTTADVLEGDASSASVVDYVVSYGEFY